MKNLITLLILVIMTSASSYCQPPQVFKYQAVIRDASGEIMSNQPVDLRISIRNGSTGGTIVYQETFLETTNQFGQVSLNIGTGTVLIGTFSGIDWSSGSKFMQVDKKEGSFYNLMGTSELSAVPYALYTERSADAYWDLHNSDIYYNGGNVGIGTNTPDNQLVIKTSAAGDVLKILDNTDNTVAKLRHTGNNSGALYLYDGSNNNTVFLYGLGTSFINGGSLGLGTASVSNAKLQIEGTGTYDAMLRLNNLGTNGASFFMGSTNSAWGGGVNENLFVMGHGAPASANIDLTVTPTGLVGIGTTSPSTNLVVKSAGYTHGMYVLASDEDRIFRIREASDGSGALYLYDGSDIATIALAGTGNSYFNSDGNIGIGTTTPNAPLHVEDRIRVGEDPTYGAVYGELIHEGGGTGFKINANAGGGWADMHLQTDGTTRVFIESGGNVGIGTTAPTSRLDVRGNITVRDAATGTIAVELGTGLDYAEGFNVVDKSNIEPGSVLCIDPENPGHLRISSASYDTKVAGIVAGANDLGTGISLGSRIHDFNVALAGRVYCNVDASSSSVEVGDLLTTSSVPGYAMKVNDRDKAQGAILGKAMESLPKGDKGQILVLVTLQ
jgi:hypothetical protein